MTRWTVTLGKGIRELKFHPEAESPEVAGEKALFTYPGWTVVKVEPYQKEKTTWNQ